tara:strand:+ start:453 stop:605 length:153 start_codon:yes stop_codon:yes gene_type:complete
MKKLFYWGERVGQFPIFLALAEARIFRKIDLKLRWKLFLNNSKWNTEVSP